MALTPRVIPKRNQRELSFNGPFTTIAGGSIVPKLLSNFSVNQPYPILNGNPTAGTYAGAFLKDTGIFGSYNPIPALNTSNGWCCTLRTDLSQFLAIQNAFNLISWTIVPVDLANYVLAAPLVPITGSFATATPANTYSQMVTGGSPGFSDYTIGFCHPIAEDDGSGLTGTYYIREIAGAVWFNAFPCDPDYYVIANCFVTLHGGGWNYTLLVAEPIAGIGPAVYMSQWQTAAYNPAGPFTFTNFSLTLSDPIDDALFQAAIDFATSTLTVLVDANRAIFICCIHDGAVTPFTDMDAFIFANDFSWYDRLTITSNGDLSTAAYFQDIDGIEYLIGPNAANTLLQFQTYVAPIIHGNKSLTDVFSLGCWSPCANLALRMGGKDSI